MCDVVCLLLKQVHCPPWSDPPRSSKHRRLLRRKPTEMDDCIFGLQNRRQMPDCAQMVFLAALSPTKDLRFSEITPLQSSLLSSDTISTREADKRARAPRKRRYTLANKLSHFGFFYQKPVLAHLYRWSVNKWEGLRTI